MYTIVLLVYNIQKCNIFDNKSTKEVTDNWHQMVTQIYRKKWKEPEIVN